MICLADSNVVPALKSERIALATRHAAQLQAPHVFVGAQVQHTHKRPGLLFPISARLHGVGHRVKAWGQYGPGMNVRSARKSGKDNRLPLHVLM